MAGEDFKTVKVSVGGKTHDIQMQQGVLFQNKGGSYCIFDDGILKFQKTGSTVWEDANQITMTNYQWKVFQNVADNDGIANTYSKADIEKAMRLYGEGNFKADMQKDLPQGYRLENPKKNSAEQYVEVDVTNGTPAQSARLRFQIAEMQATEQASSAQTSNGKVQTYKLKGGIEVRGVKTVNPDGSFSIKEKGEYDERVYNFSKNGTVLSSTRTEKSPEHDHALYTDKPGQEKCIYKCDSNGVVESAIMITNFGEPSESVYNYDIYDNYTVIKLEPTGSPVWLRPTEYEVTDSFDYDLNTNKHLQYKVDNDYYGIPDNPDWQTPAWLYKQTHKL